MNVWRGGVVSGASVPTLERAAVSRGDERRARWLRTRVGRGQLVGSAALAGQIAVIGAAAVASRWRWSLRRLWVAAMSFHSAAAAWKPRRVKERIPLPVLI